MVLIPYAGDADTEQVRRALRVVVYAMAAVIVGGTVASAVPGVRSSPSDHPSPSFAPSPAPSPTAIPTPEPSESPATPEPTTVESPQPSEEKDSAPTGSERSGRSEKESGDPEASHASSGGPDFSACAGLTGLENAVCRHEVLLQLHPGNRGLANVLAHLRENLDKHASGGGSSHGHGNPHGGGTS
jgi:hypothetical protein